MSTESSRPDVPGPGKRVDAEAPKCDACAAPVRWAPEHDALHCDHCDTHRPVPRSTDDPRELPLGDGLSRARRGYGVERRVLRCKRCGAEVALDPAIAATRCAYCSSPHVIESSEEDVIEPASLVPMRICGDDARSRFRAWLKRLWFRPTRLRKAAVSALWGLYIPYWTFDAEVDSAWTAQSGTYYYVSVPYTTMVNGKMVTRMRQERRVRWWPSSGARHDAYDDVLQCGSRHLAPHLVARLDTFKTSRLVPYQPDYLAGFGAERYTIPLNKAWPEAQGRIAQSQRRRCAGDVPGDTHRNLRVRNDFFNETFKHVLLPVWLLSYTHQGKAYTVLVNGQTGEVEGDAPLSVVKILVAVLIGLAVVLGAFLIFGGGWRA